MASFTPDQVKILTRASNDFVFFVNNIFSLSEKNFIKGEHVDNTARFLSQNPWTMQVSARNHFKSFSFYAYFMWKLLFEGAMTNIEAHYFSYNADLAGYHISKLKRCIDANPYFQDIIDCKTTAESVLKYTWDNVHFTTMHPHGLIQFKRGIHCDYVFVDDPFQDPENELMPTMIYKINEIFKSNILDMPNIPDGELHVCGTPQTKDDFFFDKAIAKRFAVQVRPAITTDLKTGERKALWPEWMSLEELDRKKEERTARIFSREYMCTPVYSTKGFFQKEKIKTVVNDDLVSLKARVQYTHDTRDRIIAGFDIGKKVDPAHLVVFEYRNGKLIMLHQKFMDNWAYSNGKQFFEPRPTQLEYLKMCIDNFGIDELRYDNTRGEFEAFAEQGLLPRQMIPIVFTTKVKNAGATMFDKLVEKQQMEIINDERMINQICAVMDDLSCVRSKEGHGEPFSSISLALMGAKDLVGFTADEQSSNVRRKIRTGQKSLFAAGAGIPRGF